MAVSIRPAACNDNDRIRSVPRAQARARAIPQDDYVELSDTAVAMIGTVFWAFVGMLAGAWLHL
ncbi:MULTISPECIES: hypothetical protein [unclassified Caulobacter]|jgi:hypothetical protein|uniref:hypothetical protein n=1 Tax=unclassified Caulobacter TaxID=2648921 RepID=UPI0013CCA9BC|nr:MULTISPECIES: hypothetical protein [unclassified Caulobacter]MBC6982282.1 hypothetical protein [Caulobacter sp. 17J80-11]NEX93481.1 hypothetical protein [Caulobacter sp. 17J65-9]